MKSNEISSYASPQSIILLSHEYETEDLFINRLMEFWTN